MLREESSGKSHPEYLKPVEDAIGAGSHGVSPATGFDEFNVGDEKFAAAFTHCVKLAEPAYGGGDVSDMSLPGPDAEGQVSARYRYTNKYQLHQLRDTQRKIVYNLVRIPGSGIEAMGTWVSDKPPSDDRSPGCSNSYGDPCGTRYLRSRAGSYERL
jgi:hypothetical protein